MARQTGRWRASRRRASSCFVVLQTEVLAEIETAVTETPRQTLSVLRRHSSLDMSRSTLWQALHEDASSSPSSNCAMIVRTVSDLDPVAAEKAWVHSQMLDVRARQRRPFRAPPAMDQLTCTRLFLVLVRPLLKHGPKSLTVGLFFLWVPSLQAP